MRSTCLRGGLIVSDKYLISTANGTMVTNTAQSILGFGVISRNCQRGAARGEGRLIGQTSLTMQPDVDIWGHLCAPSYFGAHLPAALEPGRGRSVHLSTAIDRLTGPRNDFGKQNDPFRRRGHLVPCRGESFRRQGVGCVSLFLCQPPCGALWTSCIIPEPSRENTCSGCDKWPARTLLAALFRCADQVCEGIQYKCSNTVSCPRASTEQ
jgi:hypothetical protein